MDLGPDAPHARNGPADSQSQPSIDVTPEEAGIRFEVRGCLDASTARLLAALLESAEQVEVEVVAVDVQNVTDFTEQGIAALRASLAVTRGRCPKIRYRAGPRAANALLLAAAAGTRSGLGAQ